MGIYVWGTGCGVSELIGSGLPAERITAFVDSFPGVRTFLGKPVLLPQEVDAGDCQLMIVTTRHASAVADSCAALGLPAERCLFLKNSVSLSDRNAASEAAAEALLGRPLLERILPRQRVVSVPDSLRDSRLPREEQGGDYVCLAALELLCRRLTQVPGAAAELGVYRGYFARCINRLLPERKLYLFDSFQGFAPEAGAGEAMQAAHENTSAEQVLSSLPYPHQAVMKPGFFPDSLEGLEETFCLVSLDVDFEAATLEGLRYFWPRLSPGGCLMLHDWGNPGLPGVARAMESYQQALGTRLPAVPLPDLGGTLVLCKM
ncbi:MAG: TylF/MycF/NovP-related O-methyltransferase [Faecousia sp.]